MGVGRWGRAGAEHGGATALQREEERGGAISRLKGYIPGLGLGQGPGRGHSEGWPYHRQDDPGLAAQRGHCPWARLKQACWESETRLLPSRLRFNPAAWTCPKGSGLVPGLGSEGSKATRLPTDRLHSQGKAPGLLSGPPQMLLPIVALPLSLVSPALTAAAHSGKEDGLERPTQSGQSYCSGQRWRKGHRYFRMDRGTGPGPPQAGLAWQEAALRDASAQAILGCELCA